MKLLRVVEDYLDFKKSLGFHFRTNSSVLHSFIKKVGADIRLEKITEKQILTFLNDSGLITRTWHVKYNALLGFSRFIERRGYSYSLPLPQTVPKLPPTIEPYIYSREEIGRLLKATESYQKNRSTIEPVTVRTIILLLYGCGLRASEGLALKLSDVDLRNSLITIRDTKFNKSRLVTFGHSLKRELTDYANHRMKQGHSLSASTPFFVQRSGTRIVHSTLTNIFQRVRSKANVARDDGATFQPRLHDLRHTFAVHRLTTWYEAGEDVQRLLHHLSVYMGHAHIAATQVYLTMTPELLNEANIRFAHYALRENDNETKSILGSLDSSLFA